MTALIQSEILMLARNRLVAIAAVLIPLGFGAYFVFFGAERSSPGFIAPIITVSLVGMGTYVTITTTLAARRQTGFLQRLRTTPASPVAILGGIMTPLVLINVIQVAALLVVFALVAQAAPVALPLAVLGLLIAELMFVAFALATAGVTRSPEHAQVTTLPVFFGTVAVALWVLMGDSDLGIWLPGGGIAAMMGAAFTGVADTTALAVISSICWTAIAVFSARILFSWNLRDGTVPLSFRRKVDVA